jgi:hypothetical protein
MLAFEIDQKVEDLRLKQYQVAITPELAAVGVKGATLIAELEGPSFISRTVTHRRVPCS